jgi:glycosyltransferase involved in cell wall biosynthesis
MRIAYLSTFYPFRGGIAQFNSSLFKEFKKQHDVQAFTFKRQYPNIFFPGRTQYVVNNENSDSVHGVQLLDSINPFSYLATTNRIKNFNPDILIMKYWMPFFSPSLGTVAKLLQSHTKVISILDNIVPQEKRFFDNSLTKYFLKHSDGFVIMSETVKNDLITLKSNAKFIKKEHPVYDHFGQKIERDEAIKHLKLSSDKKTLLFFGFIRDYKGLDVLIKAFDFLDDSYQLIIAGESYGSFKKYQHIIDSTKNKKNVHVFNEYINNSNVHIFFSAADVCVLPYKSATQSGIATIAYYFDLPLIATDVGGLKESIRDKGTGIIVERCEPNLIAQAIEDYFIGQQSNRFIPNIKNVKEKLSWKNFADSLIEFSREL